MKYLLSLFLILFFLQADAQFSISLSPFKVSLKPKPMKTWYAVDSTNNDHDPWAGAYFIISTQSKTQPAGYFPDPPSLSYPKDCNDNIATIYPGAAEACNGADDDCDGIPDDGLPAILQYKDADGDGYGNAAISFTDCVLHSGYVTNNTDCDDGTVAVNPGVAEICNSIDDDCDGAIDDVIHFTFYKDANGDGFYDGTSDTILCVNVCPAGFVTSKQIPIVNFAFSSTMRLVDPDYKAINSENLYLNTKTGAFTNPLIDPTFTNIRSILLPGQTLGGLGVPSGHYIRVFANDSSLNKPVGNGGFRCTQCTNENSWCCKSQPTNFLPVYTDLLQQLQTKMLFIVNIDNFDTAGYHWLYNYAKRRCAGVFGWYMSEWTITYNECVSCGDATKVANGTKTAFSFLRSIAPETQRIADVDPWDKAIEYPKYRLSAMNQAISDLIKNDPTLITAVRCYSSSRRWMHFPDGLPYNQYIDSIEYGYGTALPRHVDSMKARFKVPVAFVQDFQDPTPWSGTMLENLEDGYANICQVAKEVSDSGSVIVSMVPRLDIFNVEGKPNLKYACDSMWSQLFVPDRIWFQKESGKGSGIYAVASVNSHTHHGNIYVVNFSPGTFDFSTLSFNGYIINGASGFGIYGNSADDRESRKGNVSVILPYGVYLITF